MYPTLLLLHGGDDTLDLWEWRQMKGGASHAHECQEEWSKFNIQRQPNDEALEPFCRPPTPHKKVLDAKSVIVGAKLFPKTLTHPPTPFPPTKFLL